MRGSPPRDRARELIKKARTGAKEVGKRLRDSAREFGATGKLKEARVRLRRTMVRGAEWVEKRAHDLRVRLGEPGEPAVLAEPRQPVEVGLAEPSVAATPAPEPVNPPESPATPTVVAAPTEAPLPAAPAAQAEEAPKKKRAARPRTTTGTKKTGTTERKKTTRKKKSAQFVTPEPDEKLPRSGVAMPMELHEIGNDVYACLQQDRGLGTSNSGLVNRGGGLVIDTFWDLPHTRQLIEHYARVWKEPARRVVNTHHNGDHCWGNQLFPDAEIIAHRLCAESFARESPEMMQAVRDSAGSGDPVLEEFAAALQEWDFSAIELKPPTTLVEDRLELDLDGVPLHLIHVGPAHTTGDLIVHLPKQRVVFAGDVLFRLCTPLGWEGTYERWMKALDEIVALEPQVIVPGHGPLCGVKGPREMREYLEYVRVESRRFFEQGLSAIEAAKRIDLGPYAGWTQPERIISNIERAYREFRGEPFDTPIDVTTMIRAMYDLRHAPGFSSRGSAG
jgi:glyoxylase-like metal-dependent hydrolase (beta-lactamase superfamily II)